MELRLPVDITSGRSQGADAFADPGADEMLEARCEEWSQAIADRAEALRRPLLDIASFGSVSSELELSERVVGNAPAEIRRFRPRRIKRLCVFFPSNNLLYSYILFGLIPSLYCDEVVIRPSSRSREATLEIHRQLSGLGGSNVRIADLTHRQYLAECATADTIVFTGRYEHMRSVAEAIPEAVPLLYFGSGPNPIVAGPDCDVREVAAKAVEARLYNGGQDCLCSDLVIAHESVIDLLVSALCDRLKRIPRAERARPGLTATAHHDDQGFTTGSEFLLKHAGRIVQGGAIDIAGKWIEPAVVRLPALAGTHPEELYSPILCVAPYSSADQVRDWFNSPAERERGMFASVFGEPALDSPLLGTAVNCGDRTAFEAEDGNEPFGGYGPKASAVVVGGAETAGPLLLSAVLGKEGAVRD
jgi:acyl-CoA reductase-like NAD-dependent aldehyde dehydrogenase